MSLTVLRNKAGYSQSQLARKIDINVRTLQAYEQGAKDIAKASAETVYRLSVALGVPMEVIIGKEVLDGT